jgi:hypothetical protein
MMTVIRSICGQQEALKKESSQSIWAHHLSAEVQIAPKAQNASAVSGPTVASVAARK